jgi:hypothetical protein
MKLPTLLLCVALTSSLVNVASCCPVCVNVASCCPVCSKPPVTVPKPPEEGEDKRIAKEEGPEPEEETCPELGDGYNSFPSRDHP